jgi:hypothetical protein
MTGYIPEIVVTREHRQIVTYARRSEESIDRAHLNPGTTAVDL